MQHETGDSTGLTSNDLDGIYVDSRGLLWIGTRDAGLNCYNPKTGEIRHFRQHPGKPHSLPDSRVFVMGEEGDSLYLSCHRKGIVKMSRDGFCRQVYFSTVAGYDKDRYQRMVNIPEQILPNRDSKDSIWVSTLGGLISMHRYNGGYRLYMVNSSVPGALSDQIKHWNGFRCLNYLPDGTIILGTWGGGWTHFNPVTRKFDKGNYLHPVRPVTAYRNNIYRYYYDPDSTLIAVCPHQGIAKVDPKTLKFDLNYEMQRFGEIRNMNVYLNLLFDNQGGVFVVGNESVYYYNKARSGFKTIYFPNSPDSTKPKVIDVFPLENDQYFFSQFHRDYAGRSDLSGSFTDFIRRPAGYDEKFEGITIGDYLPITPDSVLCSESYGMLWYLPRQKKFVKAREDGLEFGIPRALAQSGNRIFVGTQYQGFFELDRKLQIVHHYRHEDTTPTTLIDDGYIRDLVITPNKKMWIATEGGFSLFDLATNTFENGPPPGYADSIVPLRVLIDLEPDGKGGIWLGDLYHGIGHLEAGSQAPFYPRLYSRREGLSGFRVFGIKTDLQGRLWLISSSELSCIDGDKVYNFGASSGLPAEGRFEGLVRWPSGKMAVYTQTKMCVFDPSALLRLKHVSAIHLSKIRASGHAVLPTNGVLHLLPNQNFLTIGMELVEFIRPGDNHLFTRLKGFDDTWKESGDFPREFSNLPPGKYTFEAKATLASGVLSSAVFELPIVVATPYYKQWWFRLGLFVLLTTILYSFYRYRINSIRNEEKLKSKFNREIAEVRLSALRAQMNPHFLFNSLNSIKYFIIKHNTDEAAGYITKFSRLLRLILHNSKRTFVPLNDELDALGLYLELETLRFQGKINYVLEIDMTDEERQIFVQPLVLQPYVENSIKHGLQPKEGPGILKVSIYKKSKWLMCVVEDDGIGRSASQKMRIKSELDNNSYGMQITDERLTLLKALEGIGGNAEIMDLYESDGTTSSGTRVVLQIPILNYESSYRG